jgi:hypothetical protein
MLRRAQSSAADPLVLLFGGAGGLHALILSALRIQS